MISKEVKQKLTLRNKNIMDLYANGTSLIRIADTYNICLGSVRNIIRIENTKVLETKELEDVKRYKQI